MTGCGRLPSHVEPANSSRDVRRVKYVERPVEKRACALDDYDSDLCAHSKASTLIRVTKFCLYWFNYRLPLSVCAVPCEVG